MQALVVPSVFLSSQAPDFRLAAGGRWAPRLSLYQSVLPHAKVENECCKKGPGYATPLQAMSGPKETLIYITCTHKNKNKKIKLKIKQLN